MGNRKQSPAEKQHRQNHRAHTAQIHKMQQPQNPSHPKKTQTLFVQNQRAAFIIISNFNFAPKKAHAAKNEALPFHPKSPYPCHSCLDYNIFELHSF
jgi:hypothetical protein